MQQLAPKFTVLLALSRALDNFKLILQACIKNSFELLCVNAEVCVNSSMYYPVNIFLTMQIC